MSNFISSDSDLIEVVQSADESDLAVIADYITDNNKGRISLDSSIKAQIDTFKRNETLKKNNDLLIKEIQEFGGNSIINLFRGKGVVYKEILQDVADHLKVSFNKNETTESIEVKILLAVAIKSMEKMTLEEQAEFINEISGGAVVGVGPAALAAVQTAILAGGFGSYILATTVANAVAKQLINRGLTFGANAGIMRGIGAFVGPIGWAITVIWTAFDLASPAYRVTLPCVLQIAYMRQKSKNIALPKCAKCKTILTTKQKYCPECGAKVGE